MLRFNIKYILIVSLISLFLDSCRNIREIENSTVKLPERYPWQSDTANLAFISWKNFFNDPALVALIDTALQNNSDLKIALQNIEIARAGVSSANGQFLPSVAATGNTSVQKYGQFTMNGASNNGLLIYNSEPIPKNIPDYYAGLQASWELDAWGKLRNNRKTALAHFLESQEGKNLVITNLVSDMANNYYELIALDNKLGIVRESIVLQDSALNIVRIQKEAGEANELAVKQFEAQVLSSKELEIEIMQQISIIENTLNTLIGRFPQKIYRNDNVLLQSVTNNLKLGIPSDLLRFRPDIKQAEYSLIASGADVNAARASFFPSINITGNYGYEAFRSSLLFSPQSVTYNALGFLVAPVLNHNALKAQFKTAKAAQLQALYNYEKSIINGYTDVYNQVLNFKTSTTLFELKSKEVAMLNMASNSSIELFLNGRANYLEVLTTQQNMLQSKIELVDVQKQEFCSLTGIYRTLGGGWK